MHRVTRLRVADLNHHLVCVLCGGYFIDATTIIECLHSFCRTCIVRYLESSKYCPICDVQVHKTRPLENIRSDKSLQDLVYKLVPNLFEDEMQRRREFYKEHLEACQGRSLEERGEAVMEKDPQAEQEDSISLCLDLSLTGEPPEDADHMKRNVNKVGDRRFLLCPGSFTIDLVKKFVRMKFSLSDKHQINVFHAQCRTPLPPCFSLMDVACLYAWRRTSPLRLYYTVVENPSKRLKTSATSAAVPVAPEGLESSQIALGAAVKTSASPLPTVNGVAEIHVAEDGTEELTEASPVAAKAETVLEKENGVTELKLEQKDRDASKSTDVMPAKAAAMKSVPLANGRVAESQKNVSGSKGGSKVKLNGSIASSKTSHPKSKNGMGGGGASKVSKSPRANSKTVLAAGKGKGTERVSNSRVKNNKLNSRVNNNNTIVKNGSTLPLPNGHALDPYEFDGKLEGVDFKETTSRKLTSSMVT